MNELTLFDDNQLPQEQSGQELFDYEVIPENIQGFILQKTAETRWLLKRSTSDIIKIGKNLLDIKRALPHGMFLKWIGIEFEMSDRSAQKFMKIARKLGDKNEGTSFLSGWGMEDLFELASASDEIIDQVIIGELPPNKEAVKKAKQEERLAKEAEARARADAQAAQQELFLLQETAQTEIDKLTEQYNERIQDLQAEIQELEVNATPKVEIRQITKEVLTQSAKNEIEDLQKKVKDLNASVEAERKTIPQEAQKQMDALQKQLDKLKEDRRLLEEANKASRDRIQHLDSQLKVAIKDRIASENDERIRQEWRSITSEARSCLMRLLGSWPTSLDINSFESDDWERLSQLKSTLKRVIEECDNLHYGGDEMVVDVDSRMLIAGASEE